MSRWSELNTWQKYGVSILAALVVASLIPQDRDNPPVTAPIAPPPEVAEVLERACYDCHSNETVWPWYSYVAPMSFLVTQDVAAGRAELNFSHWGDMDPIDRVYLREQCWEEVESGEMPPAQYQVRDRSKLSDADREILRLWAEDAMDEEEEPLDGE